MQSRPKFSSKRTRAQAEVSGLKAELAAARQQLAAQERSGEEYRALWLNNKRLGDAARTIQRCYKAWRLRRLHDHSSKTARVRSLRTA